MDKQKIDLLAPCGMYCGICDKYLAWSHQIPKKRGKVCHCQGCRAANKNCSFVKKKCVNGKVYEVDYCFKCETFPCAPLEKGIIGYKDRYDVSLADNLKKVQMIGVDAVVSELENEFRCPVCGDTICVHNQKCYTCNRDEIGI